jgi:tripartite-type tricarboxylate transporter receptor subunit TctC
VERPHRLVAREPVSRRAFLKLGGTGLAGIALLGIAGCAGPGASYPTRPVELIIPFGPGGSADISARKLADLAKDDLGQEIQGQNIPGGGGAVAYNQVKNAQPDGHMVIWSSGALNTLAATGNIDFTYEALRHAGIVATETVTLAVRNDAPWQDLKEFMQAARDQKLRVGNSGLGSFTHITAFALADDAGVQFEHVPFGDILAVTQVLGGQIEASVQHPAEILEQLEAGKIRILTVTSPEPLEAFEDIPTAREQGYDVVMTQWRGLSVPQETPDDVVQKLEDTFTKAASSEEWKKFADSIGSQPRVMGSDEMTGFIADQFKQIQDLVARMEGGG